jgi:hypothetical protein
MMAPMARKPGDPADEVAVDRAGPAGAPRAERPAVPPVSQAVSPAGPGAVRIRAAERQPEAPPAARTPAQTAVRPVAETIAPQHVAAPPGPVHWGRVTHAILWLTFEVTLIVVSVTTLAGTASWGAFAGSFVVLLLMHAAMFTYVLAMLGVIEW